jgi:DNA repair exonuclease SbcCD ATPase subunit
MLVSARNFRSFLDLDYTITGPGVVCVEGVWESDPERSNGSGKSTFISELLTWAIYGEGTEGGSTSDRVRNVVNLGQSAASVSISLPGLSWTRSQKQGGQGNKIEIAGQSFKRLAEAEAYLQSFFPPKKVFCATTVLGQGMANRLTAWSAGERAKILSDLLGLSVFEIARAKCRDKLAEFTRAIQAAKATKDAIAIELETCRNGMGNEDIDLLTQLVKELGQKGIEAQKKQESLNRKQRDIQTSLYTHSTQLGGLRATIQGMEQTREDLFRTDVCPTCGQKIPKARRDKEKRNIAEEIASQRVKLKGLQEKEDSLQLELTSITSQSQEATSKVVEIQNQYHDAQRRLSLASFTAENATKLESRIVGAIAAEKEATTEYLLYSVLDKALAPSGIPVKKMAGVLAFLNIELARICATVWENDILVQLSTERQLKSGDTKSEVSVIVSGACAPDYSACSPGERRRIDLTLQLALRKLLLGCTKNALPILVCDDVVDVLDAKARRQLYLNFLLPESDKASVFVITPSTSLPTDVPRICIHRYEDRSVAVVAPNSMVKLVEKPA